MPLVLTWSRAGHLEHAVGQSEPADLQQAVSARVRCHPEHGALTPPPMMPTVNGMLVPRWSLLGESAKRTLAATATRAS